MLFALGACSSSDPAAFPSGSGGSTGSGGAGIGGTTNISGSGGAGPSATGGSLSAGGVNASGGAVSSAGLTGTGGVNATGGATSAGGTPASGGANPTGGSSAKGGTTTGGSATGGAAAGGSSTKGGATSGGAATGGAATGGSGKGGSATGGATTGGATTGGAATGVGGHSGKWLVMPLGDSVTGSTCYPQLLSKDLIAGGHTNFQFVGTVTNSQSCGTGAPSVKTEGHGGYGVTYLPANSARTPMPCTKQSQGCGSYSELQTWAAEKPDIVLMHFATNDCWDGVATATILSAYLSVIAEFRKQNPLVAFFVSKIIPLTPSPTNVTNLNAAVTTAWATANSTATSPIYIIDHWTGFNAASGVDTSDGVHPNVTGSQKMSTASYNALVAKGYF